MMREEIKQHFKEKLIPFWCAMKDDIYGGYYGLVDYDLKREEKAVKGCILNSRILWFFANAYLIWKEDELLECAKHAYDFLKNYALDKENGGVFWSMQYDGTVEDDTKHTYNQAFAVYALSSYYDASRDKEALALAMDLFKTIESKCLASNGYKEAFTRDFKEISNEKLSENGVMAGRTMNTMLHVLEAYTELYRVSGSQLVKTKIYWILSIFRKSIYQEEKKRQEVFFDENMNSLIDLHSYGHDIESAWLIDRTIEILDENYYREKFGPITKALAENVYQKAFNGKSLANECCKGIVDETRIWWVQAEAVVGFYNEYQKDRKKEYYLEASKALWNFIKDKQIDKRTGAEWYNAVDKYGNPIEGIPVVSPWKCPYHNGRMCMEIIKRCNGFMPSLML